MRTAHGLFLALSIMISAESGCGKITPVLDPKFVAGPVGTGAKVSGLVTAAGGSLVLDGVILDIPAGAVSEDTTVTLAHPAEAPPPELENVVPIVEIGPPGLALALPAELELAVA